MVSMIAGERVWIWSAADDEGEVLDMIVQKRRDTGAALRFLRRRLKTQHVEPEVIVTHGLRSYDAAIHVLGLDDLQRPGRLCENNGTGGSYLSLRRHE
jgi:putative transposase